MWRGGWSSNMIQTHVVVLPSIWPENEPVTLLEGIASGAALIASRVGGAQDLIEHRVNGFLYESRDPDALADAMEEMITRREHLTTFSRANIERRDRLDETAAVERIAAVYEKPPALRKLSKIIVACGISAPSETAIRSIEHAPSLIEAKRLRFVWSRWSLSDAMEPGRLWIWALGWNPLRWIGLVRRLPTAMISRVS
jgi:hypothetical protein